MKIPLHGLWWYSGFALCSQKHGLVVVPGSIPNGEVEEEPLSSGITLVSQEAAQVLESAGDGPLGQSAHLCSTGKLHLLPVVSSPV